MNWLRGIFRRNEAARPDRGRTTPVSEREALDARLRAAWELAATGKLVEAEQAYRELLELDPGDADALYFLGVIALASDRAMEAADLCQKAIESRPNDSGIWFVLALAYHQQKMLQETVDAWRAAVALDPDYSTARNNYASALVDLGLIDEGREQLERVRASSRETAQLRYNLGVVYRDQGRIDDAIEEIRRAIEMTPDDKSTYTNLLLTINYHERFNSARLYEEHRRFGARFAKPYMEPPVDQAWPRRLRVGYVSPDFRNHVVMCFVEPILARHDRDRIELFCYHTHRWEDHVTARLRAIAEHWVDCAHLSDSELAQRVRADRIDILVDLAGHTGDNRLLVFAEKPAPIQISYLGYPGTTGLTAIDYRLSDAYADPPGDEDRFSVERVLRPWPTYFCFRVQAVDCPESGPLPARSTGQVTFGCFNNLPKVSPAFVRAAAGVLAAVPGSRLVLKSRTLGTEHVAQRYREQFRDAGIDPARVELRGWQASFGSHMEAYRSIDIALDSFPYNGATTTCESLWMGVPVINLDGDRHAGRMGSSLLHAVGLEGLVAASVDDYVRIAAELAGDLDRLEKLRSGLRERMRSSPLLDEAGFTRALEQCYVDIWLERTGPRAAPAGEAAAAIPSMLARITELRAAGQTLEAEEACKQVLVRQSDNIDALAALWDLSYETHNHGVAVEWLRRGVTTNPRISRLHYMMGYSLMGQGNMADAAASFQQALALDPSMAMAHNNLGCAFEALGNIDSAVACYRQAAALDPRLADAHYNLGNAHRRLGQIDQAIEFIGRALQLKGDRADWKSNLGDLFTRQLRLDEAMQCYAEALEMDRAEARAYEGRAAALQLLGRPDEACADLQEAMRLQPDDSRVHAAWLLCLHYRHGAGSLLEQHEEWARRHARGFGRQAARAVHERRPARRINVGYVSGDFKRHSVAGFIEPLLRSHDRQRFKVFGYSCVAFPDAVTRRLQARCDEWRDISRTSDEWAADRMRADRIDILIDLSGHTGDGRALLFARKVAPIQVTWLGYPNTTGIRAIDYRLTDAIADPQGESERDHVEKLVRLERGFLCYDPPEEAPGVSPLPRLSAGHLTFGCFNNLAKLTPEMIELWAQLLRSMPESRLRLKSFGLAAQSARDSLGRQFLGHGIDATRLELSGPAESFASHLSQYEGVDIALDVCPYNGAATTCEALWMGVPVVSLAGGAHVSRVGASILSHAGLPDLVARTGDEYVQKTLQLARDAARVAELRSGMRDLLRGSALLDAEGFARSVEQAYGEMLEHWVQGEEAAQAAAPPQLSSSG